jgi:hypothetical protein
MKKRNMLWSLVLAVLMALPQGMQAQQHKLSIDPNVPVSYAKAQPVTVDAEKKVQRPSDIVKNHRRPAKADGRMKLLREHRTSLNNLLERHAPIQITSDDLRKAAKAKPRKVAYTPDDNHKHLIVNVTYNTIDESKMDGIFDLDIVTGVLTCLIDGFVDDYENYGFNGGSYIWNGKFRGVYYDDEYNVSNSHQATIMEFDMTDWSITDIFDIPYMSTMALECGTQFNADGTTSVVGQY